MLMPLIWGMTLGFSQDNGSFIAAEVFGKLTFLGKLVELLETKANQTNSTAKKPPSLKA